MATNYVQTDTDAGGPGAGCTGVTAAATTIGRDALVGGTAGSTPVAVDPGNNVTRSCFGWRLGGPSAVPGLASWASGTWVVPINHNAMDAGTTLVGVYVCDYNGSTWQSVASNTSPGHSAGGTGVVTVNVVQGSDYTPQSQANSFPAIILVYQNTDAHGASGLEITPNQTIVAPFGTTATELTVADAVHDHAADAPALTQANSLVVADAAHGHAAEAPSLTQAFALEVAGAAHAHSAEAPSLTQANALAVDDADHAHAAEAPTLSVPGTVDPDELGTELAQQAGELVGTVLYDDCAQPGRAFFRANTESNGGVSVAADIDYQSAATAGITPREGGNVMRFRCLEDDGGTRSENSLADSYGPLAGGYYSDLGASARERWVGLSVYIKSSDYSTPWTATFGFIFYQWHGPGSTTPPVFLKIGNGTLDVGYAARYDNPTDGYQNVEGDTGVDLTTDAWNDFVLHWVLDPYGGNGGLLQIWHRVAGNSWPGTPQVNLSSIKLGYYDDAPTAGSDNYHKHGIYALNWTGTGGGQTAILYEDCLRIADDKGDFEAVAPGRDD